MYKSPKECYIKAPVRRETRMERKHRQFMQVPKPEYLASRLRAAELLDYVTVNKDLVPGEAKYVKEPCKG